MSLRNKKLETRNRKRIDKIVSLKYPDLSRAEIKNLAEKGGIFVLNKIINDVSKKVSDNTEIKIDEGKLEEILKLKEINLKPDASVKFDVIYEDEDIAVIEKLAGLVVHPSHTHKSGTLVNGLLARWPQISGVGDDPARPGIVHRLDKDVSGVMAIAKSQAGSQSLKRQFQNRTAKKTYLALVYGKPPAERGIITGAITRSKSDPTKQIISDGGKEAITEYKIVSKNSRPNFSSGCAGFSPKSQLSGLNHSLIQARPLTGRMHQIRVHLASIGCPIVGDKKYLPKDLLKIDKADRIMLHSQSLEIELMNGERRKFESKSKFETEL